MYQIRTVRSYLIFGTFDYFLADLSRNQVNSVCYSVLMAHKPVLTTTVKPTTGAKNLLSNIYNIYIQYDPLIMQQKEARRKHPCVLPKKVACLV